jgi:hypothetical protein
MALQAHFLGQLTLRKIGFVYIAEKALLPF